MPMVPPVFPRSFCLILGLLFLAPAWAQKTDIVILTNGDKLTGEIKNLEAGLLEYSTDTMGTVQIEWRFIEQIITSKKQTIETVDGDRLLGRLQKSESGEGVVLVTASGSFDFDPDEVVSAWPVEATVLDKIDLKLSLGYNYAKSTGISELTTAADFQYRTQERLFSSSFRGDITSQGGADDQNRQQFNFTYQRLLKERKFRALLAGYDVNESISLDLRLYAGAAFGNYLVKTNHNWFSLAGGLIATRERPVTGEDTESLEAVGLMNWRYFSYATPERTLDTTLSVFPSLTESGRWRSDLRTTFNLELAEDLFWAMEFYSTYDNDPIDEGAETSDYGITTSLGWSY